MVSVYDSISIATQIACIGNTEIAIGSHLHYEIRKGNRFLNPTGWCYLLFEILKTNDYTAYCFENMYIHNHLNKNQAIMNYIESNLQPGEEIKYVAKLHFFLFVQPLVLLLLGWWLYGPETAALHYSGIFLLFIGVVSLVQRLLVKIGSTYAVTNKRVVLKTGVISRKR